MKKTILIILTGLTTILFLFLPAALPARPGGGHSYRSSSSSSSSHSSGYSSSSSSSSSSSYSVHFGDNNPNYKAKKETLGAKILYSFLFGLITTFLWYILFAFIVKMFEGFLYKRPKLTRRIFDFLIFASIPVVLYRLYLTFFEGANHYDTVVYSTVLTGLLFAKVSILDDFEMKYYLPLKSKLGLLKEKEKAIAEIRKDDPNFSEPVFIDFVSSIYTKMHRFKDNPKKFNAILGPFIEQVKKEYWLQEDVGEIKEFVIGSISIVPNDAKINAISVKVKSNYTVRYNSGDLYRVYKTETVSLERKNTLSPEPEKMHDVQCPVCGAPADFNDAGICKFCGSTIVAGRYQWYIYYLNENSLEKEKTDQGLVSYAKDKGLQDLTVVASDIQEKIKRFEQKNQVNWEEYYNKLKEQKIAPVFQEIYRAWSSNDWLKIRHLMSDRLWESWNYWIETYKSHNLQNILEKTKIKKIELANLNCDKFYESLTVRITAKLKDYTIDSTTKKIVGGEKEYTRFSEYWTFVRYSGTEDKFDILHCPNCGAPADKIGQSGICEYCGTKITTGRFGWILFKVTQDEEYPG